MIAQSIIKTKHLPPKLNQQQINMTVRNNFLPISGKPPQPKAKRRQEKQVVHIINKPKHHVHIINSKPMQGFKAKRQRVLQVIKENQKEQEKIEDNYQPQAQEKIQQNQEMIESQVVQYQQKPQSQHISLKSIDSSESFHDFQFKRYLRNFQKAGFQDKEVIASQHYSLSADSQQDLSEKFSKSYRRQIELPQKLQSQKFSLRSDSFQDMSSNLQASYKRQIYAPLKQRSQKYSLRSDSCENFSQKFQTSYKRNIHPYPKEKSQHLSIRQDSQQQMQESQIKFYKRNIQSYPKPKSENYSIRSDSVESVILQPQSKIYKRHFEHIRRESEHASISSLSIEQNSQFESKLFQRNLKPHQKSKILSQQYDLSDSSEQQFQESYSKSFKRQLKTPPPKPVEHSQHASIDGDAGSVAEFQESKSKRYNRIISPVKK